MKIEQVAVQLYTVRDFCKTPADIAETLKKVRQLGYHAVQASGLGPIEESELVKLIQGEGLTLCATHEFGKKILEQPEAIVERLKKLGCAHTAYPWPDGIDLTSLPVVLDFARKLEKAGEVLAAAGCTLSYHNHAHEFFRLGDRTVLEILYAETSDTTLKAELDTYWVQHGGGDPVAWCRKMKGRMPLLHMKDYSINDEFKPVFAEIGHGNLNFKEIVAAAQESGCEWYIVEQDTCPGDPFDSLRKSFEYISEHLVSK